jgi:hypothetical protein
VRLQGLPDGRRRDPPRQAEAGRERRRGARDGSSDVDLDRFVEGSPERSPIPMRRLREINRKFVAKAISENIGRVSNDVLYKLCKDHPRHTVDAIIIAKVLLIGRTYSAAMERGRKKRRGEGDFYETRVAPMIRRSDIDKWFAALRRDKKNADTNLNLETHMKVVKLFAKISGRGRRSLASKYLHFHFPQRFYIYDSGAKRAISKLIKLMPNRTRPQRSLKHDFAYARFYYRCQAINKRIAPRVGRPLSPRDLDNVLLELS